MINEKVISFLSEKYLQKITEIPNMDVDLNRSEDREMMQFLEIYLISIVGDYLKIVNDE